MGVFLFLWLANPTCIFFGATRHSPRSQAEQIESMRNAKALAYYTAITGAALGLAADEVGEIGSSRLVHRSSLHGMA